jgi:hypothetical protein
MLKSNVLHFLMISNLLHFQKYFSCNFKRFFQVYKSVHYDYVALNFENVLGHFSLDLCEKDKIGFFLSFDVRMKKLTSIILQSLLQSLFKRSLLKRKYKSLLKFFF